jgi:hypothetical protein
MCSLLRSQCSGSMQCEDLRTAHLKMLDRATSRGRAQISRWALKHLGSQSLDGKFLTKRGQNLDPRTFGQRSDYYYNVAALKYIAICQRRPIPNTTNTPSRSPKRQIGTLPGNPGIRFGKRQERYGRAMHGLAAKPIVPCSRNGSTRGRCRPAVE